MDLERRREVRRRIAELALAPSVDQLQPSAAQPGECSEGQLPGGSLDTDHRIPGYWGGDLAWPADESTYPSGMAKVKVCGMTNLAYAEHAADHGARGNARLPG